MGKTLEELMAEIEKKAEAQRDSSSETVPEADKTVYEDSVETMPEDSNATMPETETFSKKPVRESSSGIYKKGQTLLDTYTVESEPIHGGMGSVWRVHHKGWNVDLAMKRPQAKLFQSERQKENFIGECEAWINLGLHPNIVSCYYVREIDGVPTIFSEWMENSSLENHIQKGTLYTGSEQEQQERLLDIAIQFARGLHYAHEHGLIHQDVKPDNVLLSREWDAKVADFGLAKARAQLTILEGENTVRDAGATVMAPSGGYTPAYCSMEQMDGKPLTRRTDIYSWAVSVMEMYLGERLWDNGVVAGYGCPAYFASCRVPMPERLKALLKKCMAAEPEDRPHDFGTIETELTHIYREATGSDYPRPASTAAADTADSLNNRALSYLDMGKTDEAEKLWKEALEKSPNHLESIFNQGLHKWRSGQISDNGLIRQLEQYKNNGSSFSDLIQTVRVESGAHVQIAKQPVSDFYIGGAERPPENCISRDHRRALVKKDDGRYQLVETEQDGSERILKEYCRQNVVTLTKLKRYSAWALSGDGETVAVFCSDPNTSIIETNVIFSVEFIPLEGEPEVIRLPDNWSKGLNGEEHKIDCMASDMAFTADGSGVYICFNTGSVLLLKRNRKRKIAAKRHFHYSSKSYVFVDRESNQVVIGEQSKKSQRNGLIHVLRADTLEPLRTFPVNGSTVKRVCCLRESIYAFYEQSIWIWDRNTGKCRHSILFSEHDDVKGVITGWVQPDGTIYCRNGIYLGQDKSVFSFRYSGEGEKAPFLLNRIATVSERSSKDREYESLCQRAESHIQKGEQIQAFDCLAKARQIHGYEEDQRILDLNERAGKGRKKLGVRNLYLRGTWEGSLAVMVPESGELYIWSDKLSAVDLKTGQIIREAGYSPFIDNRLCARKNFLAYDSGSTIRINSSSDFSQRQQLKMVPRYKPGDATVALEAYSDPGIMFAADRDGNVKLWDTVSWQCAFELNTGLHDCTAAARNEDGTRLFIAGIGRPGKGKRERQCYRIYDMRTGEILLDRALEPDNDLKEIAGVVWVGNRVVFLRRSVSVSIFDERAKDKIRNLFIFDSDTGETTVPDGNCCVSCFDAVPGCDWVVISRGLSSCVLFSVGTLQNGQSFNLCAGQLKRLKISPDGRYIMASVRDSLHAEVNLWEIDWIYE